MTEALISTHHIHTIYPKNMRILCFGRVVNSWYLLDTYGLFPYSQSSSISSFKSKNVNVSCLVLHLSLSDPLKPGVKPRMKM